LLSVYGAFYVLGLIPLMHRVLRIRPEQKLEAWAKALESYGFADPSALSERVLMAIHFVCVLGFLGAGLWLFLHLRNKHRFRAFPVLWLSGVMLLIQNLNALYFFYPRRPGTINMHFVFWVIYGLMIAYAVFARRPAVTDPDDVAERVNWRRWIAGSLAVYGLTIFLAGFVNGEKTMASANTRFPIWSWRDGR
jgi:hypothetical protein